MIHCSRLEREPPKEARGWQIGTRVAEQRDGMMAFHSCEDRERMIAVLAEVCMRVCEGISPTRSPGGSGAGGLKGSFRGVVRNDRTGVRSFRSFIVCRFPPFERLSSIGGFLGGALSGGSPRRRGVGEVMTLSLYIPPPLPKRTHIPG